MKTKLLHVSVLAFILAITIYGSVRSAGNGSARDEPQGIVTAPTAVALATQSDVTPKDEPQLIPGAPVVLKYDPVPNSYKIGPPAGVLKQGQGPASAANVSIIVVYNTAASCPLTHPSNPAWTRQPWPADAEAVMDLAALIWSTLLNGPQPVIVHACWYSSLGANVLGQAAPANFVQNFANAPQANTFYPVALANQLANTDLNGTTPDIGASFSAAFTWYFGTDGNIPVDAAGNPTATDFLSVALHEIGHGLGFSGSANVDDGVAPTECNGTALVGCLGNPLFAYDRHARSGSTYLTAITNPSAALGSALFGNGNLNFNGPTAVAANGGNAPRLFSPNPWQPGSSYSHLDEATFNNTVNALMTPALANGESLHYPGPVGLGMLADIGWQINGFLTAAVDWRNTGFEDGSFDHPYNTVQEGVAAVRDNGLVYITAGNYDETVTILRPMSLLATGGSVTIGE